jgi:hypothetical protein
VVTNILVKTGIKIDHNHSRSFKPATLNVSTHYGYADGTLLNCTIIGTDDLYLGATRIFEAQPICATYFMSLPDSFEENLPYDGIMGLGIGNDIDAIVDVEKTFLPKFKSVSFWYNQTILTHHNINGEVGFKKSDLNVGRIVFGDIEASKSLYGKIFVT